MLRKFRRDKLRKLVGSKGIAYAWANYQIKKYGKDYKAICEFANKPRQS